MYLQWMFQWLTQLLLLTAVCGNIHVGGALNVFSYFGDLGTLVNVNPHLDRSWFFDGSSIDVFEEAFESKSALLLEESAIFNGNFDLELCPTLSSLYEALFRNFKIDGIEKPWRAFTGGWTKGAAARYLGLNSSFVTKSHSYALVRLIRNHEEVRLSPHDGLHLNNWTSERISHIVPGQVRSVMDFIQVSGSHYVSSYSSGNSLYQVFVFTPARFAEVYQALGKQQFFNFFTPFYAEHVGSIISVRDDPSLNDWIANHLTTRILMFHFPNLIKLRSAPELLHSLNYLLGNDALLSVELKSLAYVITDDAKRLWFKEVLENHLNMWELNV